MRTLVLFTLLTLVLTPGVYRNYKSGKPINFIPFCALCFCVLCLLASVVTAVKTQVNMEKDAQVMLEQREALVERLDNEDMSESEWLSLKAEINAFNEIVHTAKRDAENPWVDWFTNTSIAAIRPIDIPMRETDELSY